MNPVSSAVPASVWKKRTTKLGTFVLTCAVILASSGCGKSDDAEAGEVIRVVDGDTLIVALDAGQETVRLLNVDTPETKDPNEPVECMGLEATAFLERLTPPGTKIGLDYDVERTDRYGRTLAAVFLEDESLVNAEIVRSGYGVPVVFEPNRKYYDQVLKAQDEAKQAQAGLYDDGGECTLPAEVQKTVDSLEAAVTEPAGTTAAAAGTALVGLAAALAAAKALRETIDTSRDSAWVAAISSTKLTSLLSRLEQKIAGAEKRHFAVSTEADRLKTAEAAAKARAEAEKTRKAAEAKAEKERVAAEAERVRQEAAVQAEQERLAAVERERLRNLPPAPAPYVPPAPAPYVPPAPAPYVPPAPPPQQQNPYPGYTGPRCYAPGGKTWKPCP